jgi:hypothetical protein
MVGCDCPMDQHRVRAHDKAFWALAKPQKCRD